ncbi:hypothetical protein BBJ28_00021216 [Nothophytophthora sp. Chile5]|nr:hypothetical protein BBJ28_00021216 [Nothophytophthora sp. Chile5]
MGAVNCYIVHTALWERKKKKKHSHYAFMADLHAKLIEVTEADFTDSPALSGTAEATSATPIAVSADHALVQTTDMRTNNGVQRLRQRQCKVCTFYKPPERKRGGTSTYYCAKCSEGKKGFITLCNRVRGHKQNEGFTCAQIWHLVWQNGEFAPTTGHIRDRRVVES